MSYMKNTILNLIPDKMKINCNMLHSRMKNGIGAELSCSNIITINVRAVGKRNANISQEITNEIKFSICICEENDTQPQWRILQQSVAF